MNDTAIIVTAYCDGENSEIKKYMAKTICKNLYESNHTVILCSHSILDEETQQYCTAYIYDSDNRKQINGYPSRPNTGVGEITNIINGINYLKMKGFSSFLKVTFDQRPDIDYHRIISNCIATNKEYVGWVPNYALGTMCFYSTFDFFERTLRVEDLHYCDVSLGQGLEAAWMLSVKDKGMMDKVFMGYTGFGGESSYQHFLGLGYNERTDFSNYSGEIIESYDY